MIKKWNNVLYKAYNEYMFFSLNFTVYLHIKESFTSGMII